MYYAFKLNIILNQEKFIRIENVKILININLSDNIFLSQYFWIFILSNFILLFNQIFSSIFENKN